MKRIGILTAGGDTPALNATIQGAVARANQHKVEVYGFIKGFAGVILPEVPHVHLNPLFMSIPELDATNKRLSTETRKPRQYELDSAFHSRLTRDCGNRRLLKLIKDHWAQARRFDGARARGTADRDGSCREHQGIIDAIRRGRTGAAADLLLEHWRRGEDTVTAWLRENS